MLTKTLSHVSVKDDGSGSVSAIFSTFDVIDHDGDVVVKSAIKDGTAVVIGSYNHSSWGGDALPIGKGIIRTTDSEAVLEGKFFIDTPHGAAAHATIKELAEDDLQEWSYSLEDVKSHREQMDGRSVNVITSVDIKEVCPVIRGASIGTRTLAIKQQQQTFSEHADTVLAAVDALTVRASEVVALRAEKGKTISDDSRAALAQVEQSLERLKVLLVEPTPDTTPDDEMRAALDAEYLRFVGTSQGVTTCPSPSISPS